MNLETTVINNYNFKDQNWKLNISQEKLISFKNIFPKIFFSTANNHCLDYGIEGLINTINCLNDLNIPFTGTNKHPLEKKYNLFTKSNLRISFTSFTYGTNTFVNNVFLESNQYFVNIFHPQELTLKFNKLLRNSKSILFKLIRKFLYFFDFKDFFQIKRNIYEVMFLSKVYFIKFAKILKKIKIEKTDLNIMLLHYGGQYNLYPNHNNYILANKISKLGYSIIVGNHEHLINPIKIINSKTIIAYCLGNFFSTDFIIYKNKNFIDYSMLLNLYLTKDKNSELKYQISFSILKYYLNLTTNKYEVDFIDSFINTSLSSVINPNQIIKDKTFLLDLIISNFPKNKLTYKNNEYFIDIS